MNLKTFSVLIKIITKKIADLGFVEKDIHGITTDEEIYIKYEKWRKTNNI